MENKNEQVAPTTGAGASAGGPATEHPAYYVPRFSVDGSGYIGGWYPVLVDREEFYNEVLGRGELVLLNAVVPYEDIGMMFVSKIATDDAVELMRRAREIKSYIGHVATAQVLSTATGREIQMNRDRYVPRRGNVALVARLKTRPAGDVKDVRLEDLEFMVIWYL
ncbi:MAG: STIV orfB116 family protein [Thermoproteus sp.]